MMELKNKNKRYDEQLRQKPESGNAALFMVLLGMAMSGLYIARDQLKISNMFMMAQKTNERNLADSVNMSAASYAAVLLGYQEDRMAAIYPDPYISKLYKDGVQPRSMKLFLDSEDNPYWDYDEITSTATFNNPDVQDMSGYAAVYDKDFRIEYPEGVRTRETKLTFEKFVFGSPTEFPYWISAVQAELSTTFVSGRKKDGTTILSIPPPLPSPKIVIKWIRYDGTEGTVDLSDPSTTPIIEGGEMEVSLIVDGVASHGRIKLYSKYEDPATGKEEGYVEDIEVGATRDADGYPTHGAISVSSQDELLGTVTLDNYENNQTYTVIGEAIGVDGTVRSVQYDVQTNIPPKQVLKHFAIAERVVDYVFVIDDSVSMSQILANVRSGFKSLASAKNIFPPNSRVAVMSTLPSDLTTYIKYGSDNDYYLTKLHDHVKQYSQNIGREPGFVNFVSKARIADFLYWYGLPNHVKKHWTMPGCEDENGDGWFSPNDKNQNGDWCIEAHTQISLTAVVVEAGISSYASMIMKRNLEGKKVFRDNAIVNVIFVSDTHDPGAGSASLAALLEVFDFDKLDELTRKNNDQILGLKFHALAPYNKCTSEGLWDKSYFKLVDASGGVKKDVCNLKNYTGFIESMAENSNQIEILSMDLDALHDSLEIDYVTLNGKWLDPDVNPKPYWKAGSSIKVRKPRDIDSVVKVVFK